ncbi:MAG TPA: M20/M25/M40 family metallo-hydrolase [Gemmatimonadaceae bacterium]|nr:M20/M25/M40 family metallo-hydrolase [Gemmatimonadaceae bacterium]
MRRFATLLSLALGACAQGPAVDPAPSPAPTVTASAPRPATVTPIDVSALRADLTLFASDAFQGRLAGTPAARRAAEFIAERLTSAGLEPAGDSGFFQRVPLSRQVFAPTTKFLVTSRGRASELKLGEDVAPILRVGEYYTQLSAEGELVFAGYALNAPQLGRNDLAGLNIAGKIVVFLGGAPPTADSATRARLESPEQLGQRLGAILNGGAAGVVILAVGKLEDDFDAVASEVTSGSLELGAGEAEPTRAVPMVMFARPRSGSPLLPSGWPTDDKPQALGRHLTAKITLGRAQAASYNVVAVLRGSDPALSRTYVALGAHLDHIGVQPNAGRDSIANGADDDGSGSMALVAIARALAKSPERPRRSVLFVWHTGEEAGMLGSEWFVTHPTVPLDSVVAQLNADMIGRNAPDSLMLVGPRAAPGGQSRVLGTLVDSVNTALSRPFVINREWDSPDHPEQIYFRSDHYSYAKRGIPIVFYTTGLHEDYHKVSDEVAKIDFDKLSRVSDLIMRSALAVANRSERPRAR